MTCPPVVTGAPIWVKGPSSSPLGLKSDPFTARKRGSDAVGVWRKNSIVAGVCGGRIVNIAGAVSTVATSCPTVKLIVATLTTSAPKLFCVSCACAEPASQAVAVRTRSPEICVLERFTNRG